MPTRCIQNSTVWPRVALIVFFAVSTLVTREGLALHVSTAGNEEISKHAHVGKFVRGKNWTQRLVQKSDVRMRATSGETLQTAWKGFSPTLFMRRGGAATLQSSKWWVCVTLYMVLLTTFIWLNLRARRERKHANEEYYRFYDSLSDAKHVSYEQGIVFVEKQRQGNHIVSNGVFSYNSLGNHLVKYDEQRSISFQVLFMFSNTLLARPEVTNQVLVSLFLGLSFFAIAFTFEDTVSQVVSVNELHILCNFITSLVGVLLGFYVATVYGRWWALRNDTLGSLWGAVDDISCLMGAHFAEVEFRKTRSLVLRYCMASFELTFMQATGNDDELWRLVNRQLLTVDEANKLQLLPSKSQVVWTWIAGIFNGLHRRGVLDNIILQLFYSKSVQARGAIGAIFAYLDTQVPFVYVQMLAGIVHVLTLAIALTCGFSTAKWARSNLDSEAIAENGTLVNIFQLVVVPYFYNGCLEVARIMSNPLGDDFHNFPRYAFFHFMRREAEAFHTTFEVPCAAVVEALGEVSGAKIVEPPSD